MLETYWELSFKYYSRATIHSMRLDDEAEAWKKWDELQANSEVKSTMLRKITIEAGGHGNANP